MTNLKRHRKSLYVLASLTLVWAMLASSTHTAGAQTPMPAGTETGAVMVPADWDLKPAGLETGERFRLLFVTSTSRNAEPTDIATYNTFVQTLVNSNGHTALRPHASLVRVLGSSASVDARDNTGMWSNGAHADGSTTDSDPGTAVYWVNGTKVADNYFDFFDSSWDSASQGEQRSEAGTALSANANIFTGSFWNGVKSDFELGDTTKVRLGSQSGSDFRIGWRNPAGESPRTASLPFYGVSPLFQVAAPGPVAQFASATYGAGEAAGSRSVNAVVNIAPAPTSNINVTYTVGGTATSGTDFTALSGSVTVNSGATSVDIPITISDDTSREGPETIVLTLTEGAAYDVGDTSITTVTTKDDDTPEVTLSIGSGTAGTIDESGSDSAVVTVMLSEALGADVTIPVVRVASGSTAATTDYAATPADAMVTIAAGSTKGTLNVAAAPDTLDEVDETVVLGLGSLPSAVVAGGQNQVTITITDDDPATPSTQTPGTQNPRPGAQTPDPGTQNPRPGAQTPDPGTQAPDGPAGEDADDSDAESSDEKGSDEDASDAESSDAESSDTDAEQTFTLTILHNNDGESKLLPDEDAGFPGVARFVAQMKLMQAAANTEGAGVITLTSGDNFLASQELGVSLANEGALYDSIALSGLYDAMALGNHDFDLGPEVTARFISGFDPAIPFLSANADFSDEPVLAALVEEGRLAASTTIETGGQKIGVIGAVTPQLPNISSPRNVAVSDVLAAVTAEAESLTEDGVNKIILVSHLQDVDEEITLVASLSDVDVVIAGGGDDLLRNDGDTCMPDDEPAGPYPTLVTDADDNEVPVITAPGGYRCIGELTVNFDEDGNIVSTSGRSLAVGFDAMADTDVETKVVEPLAAAVAKVDADVIGTSEVDLDGRRTMVRTTSTNQGNLHADALRATATNLAASFGITAPDVAIQNGGGIRNDAIIPAGDVTTGDTWDIAPFRNFVVVLEVPRETFHILLEQAVDRIPGAGGQFAQISGFTLTYDPAATARETDRSGDCSLAGEEGSRVRDVVLDDGTAIVRDGKVVPGDPVTLATIDFLAGGGDCYPLANLEFTKLGVSYQQALADFIADDLGGKITAADYPVGGDNRIVALPAEMDSDPEPEAEPEPEPEAEPEPETEPEPEADPEPEPQATPEPKTVTVVRGNTLWGLARTHLGSGFRWQDIFDLNKGKVQADGKSLADPSLILVGWVLEIPSE